MQIKWQNLIYFGMALAALIIYLKMPKEIEFTSFPRWEDHSPSGQLRSFVIFCISILALILIVQIIFKGRKG